MSCLDVQVIIAKSLIDVAVGNRILADDGQTGNDPTFHRHRFEKFV
jgi:hypothetical protein